MPGRNSCGNGNDPLDKAGAKRAEKAEESLWRSPAFGGRAKGSSLADVMNLCSAWSRSGRQPKIRAEVPIAAGRLGSRNASCGPVVSAATAGRGGLTTACGRAPRGKARRRSGPVFPPTATKAASAGRGSHTRFIRVPPPAGNDLSPCRAGRQHAGSSGADRPPTHLCTSPPHSKLRMLSGRYHPVWQRRWSWHHLGSTCLRPAVGTATTIRGLSEDRADK